MTTLETGTDFVAATTIVAADMNTRFNNIEAWANTYVVLADSGNTRPFTVIPVGPASDPTVANEFTRKLYVDSRSGQTSAAPAAPATTVVTVHPTNWFVIASSETSITLPAFGSSVPFITFLIEAGATCTNGGALTGAQFRMELNIDMIGTPTAWFPFTATPVVGIPNTPCTIVPLNGGAPLRYSSDALSGKKVGVRMSVQQPSAAAISVLPHVLVTAYREATLA